MSILAVEKDEGEILSKHSRNSGKTREMIIRRRQSGGSFGMCGFILTGRLDKLRVGVVRDEWDWEIPEVKFQRASDDVDVFIHVHRNICLLPILEGG